MSTNGLPALDNYRNKQKCPDSPTKKKYATLAAAKEAARESSSRAKMSIDAYACPGCGFYHLTRKVDGSDIVREDGASLLTASMKRHPAGNARVERSDDPELYPPGNFEAREKRLAEYAVENPGALSVAEVQLFLGVSVDTARETMRKAGFQPKRGPGARWDPPQPVEESVDDIEDSDWRTPTSFPAHVTIDDYVRAMDGVGLAVRIQVRAK